MKIKHCDPSVSPDCPGHYGWQKLGSCLIEALYGSTPDDVTGTVDGFGKWVGLFTQDQAETIDMLSDPGTIKVTIPAGTYGLLIEDEYGAVDWQEYTDAQAAQDAFDTWVIEYDRWDAEAEMREFSIVSSVAGVW
jgi:hypothetical protein